MQLRFEFPPLSKKVTSYTLARYIKNIQEVQDGAAKISAIAWSHNNMKLAVCTADRVPKLDKPACLTIIPDCDTVHLSHHVTETKINLRHQIF